MYAALWSIWILPALQVSHPDPWARIEYPVCAAGVCVCVYTHTYSHTLPLALKNIETQTTLLSFLPSKMTSHAKP